MSWIQELVSVTVFTFTRDSGPCPCVTLTSPHHTGTVSHCLHLDGAYHTLFVTIELFQDNLEYRILLDFNQNHIYSAMI